MARAKTPILNHYTSQEGLLGIIQDKKILCTEIRYLNDSAEFNYCIELFRDLVMKKNSPKVRGAHVDEGLLEYVLDLVKTTTEPMYSGFKMFFFVFCFSGKSDSLSQWRGYCPENGGFSLQFDFEKICDLASNQNFRLLKCIYKREDQLEVLEKLVEACFYLSKHLKEAHKRGKFTPKGIKSIKEIYPSNSFSTQESVNEILKSDFQYLKNQIPLELYLKLISIAPQIKHPAFIEEKEWRLVSPPISIPCARRHPSLDLDKKIKFRQGKSMIIPYVKFDLTDDNGQNWPINEIMIGPTPHLYLSKQSVMCLLKANMKSTVKVETSKIPFRSW